MIKKINDIVVLFCCANLKDSNCLHSHYTLCHHMFIGTDRNIELPSPLTERQWPPMLHFRWFVIGVLMRLSFDQRANWVRAWRSTWSKCAIDWRVMRDGQKLTLIEIWNGGIHPFSTEFPGLCSYFNAYLWTIFNSFIAKCDYSRF